MAEIGHDVLGVYRGLDPAALLDIEPVILDARNNLDLARWRAAG